MRRPWLAALFVVAAACSSRPRVDAPGFANGTRLAARFDDLDGTRLFVAFYDQTRDEECTFQLLPDGSAACLPKSGLLDGWFADGACSDPLVDVPSELPGRTPARALVTGAANACSDAPTVQTLGDLFSPTEAYYLKSDGTCVQNPPNAIITLRRIGDAVPLDQFVHAKPEVDAVSPSVGAVVLAADDGARFTLFGNDPTTGEWTHSVDDGAGASRWWPVHIAYNYGPGAPGTPGALFADAGCSVPTGIKDAYDALCPITTVFEFVPSTDPCQPYTFRLHHAGASVAAGDLHALDGSGACVASPPAANVAPQLYVEMGDALPDDAFPPATVVDVGSGRVVQRFDGSPDGVAITARRELHDNARGIDCTIGLAADGQRRCLPPAADAIYYADAGCATPMVTAPAPTGCATAAMPLEEAFQTHAYPVGAPLSPTMLYEQSDSGCTLVGRPFSGASWFALGPEIPPSAYQPATLRTE